MCRTALPPPFVAYDEQISPHGSKAKPFYGPWRIRPKCVLTVLGDFGGPLFDVSCGIVTGRRKKGASRDPPKKSSTGRAKKGSSRPPPFLTSPLLTALFTAPPGRTNTGDPLGGPPRAIRTSIFGLPASSYDILADCGSPLVGSEVLLHWLRPDGVAKRVAPM